MARPRGLTLHEPALRLFLASRRLTLTEAAEMFGLSLATLSGLAKRHHRASMTTVRLIEANVGTDVVQALFPELDGIYAASNGGGDADLVVA